MRAAAIVVIALALAGCATSGTKITQGQLNQVVSGQTTRSDLVRLFGPPTSEVYGSDGTQVMGWGYAHVGFAGIGTEIQGVSMITGPDGTVSGYTRTGSAPDTGLAMAIPTAAPAQQVTAEQPLSEQAYRRQQLDLLMQQNLPYEEYQKRYRQIMGQ